MNYIRFRADSVGFRLSGFIVTSVYTIRLYNRWKAGFCHLFSGFYLHSNIKHSIICQNTN